MEKPTIKVNNKVIPQAEILMLHPLEAWLLKNIRDKCRFGEITIKTQNGVPVRIIRTIIYDDPRDDGVSTKK